MKLPCLIASFFVVTVTAAPAGFATPIDDLIAAAKKEGSVEFFAAGTLGAEGAQKLGEAFNKKYGLNLKTIYHPSSGMARDIAKTISLAASGLPAEWDVMMATDAHHASLWLKKAQQRFDYVKVGVNPRWIQYDSSTVILAHGFALPAYNKKFLPAEEAPKSWDDLLDPKWKGGKLGITDAVHHLARLATAWGEERTNKYVKTLADQQAIIGQPGHMFSRLQIGEIKVAFTLGEGYIHSAKLAGAPVVHAEAVEPVIAPATNAGVIKNARHPNAGYLFTVFLTTAEAQKIWQQYRGESSAFVPGTPAHEYAQRRKMVYMTQEHAELINRLTTEYGKVLGFSGK
jgi:ABC-type Fe3+ transport system substrate-binding protein